MSQDTVDSILMTAANTIERKNFLEANIDLLPKGSIVMHTAQKHPAPYLHQYKNGQVVASRITKEQALILSSQFRVRQCYVKELQVIDSFLKRNKKLIKQAYDIQLKRSRCKMPILPTVQSENTYRDEDKIHISSRKERMRSRAEILVSDALIAAGLNYQYEKKLLIDGKAYYPDFTVTCPLFPYEIYVEYCGLSSAEYIQRQHQKILEYEKGGIVQGINLLVIWECGGLLDASYIRELISSRFTMARYREVEEWLDNRDHSHT